MVKFTNTNSVSELNHSNSVTGKMLSATSQLSELTTSTSSAHECVDVAHGEHLESSTGLETRRSKFEFSTCSFSVFVIV